MNDPTTPKQANVSADRPGSDPSLDRLGYVPFAKRLAQSIAGIEQAGGTRARALRTVGLR